MATLLLVLIYIAFISLGLPDALLGAGWPAMQPEFGVSYGFAGFVSMIISGGTIVSSIFSSRVLRRFGTGRVTAASVGLTAVALFGFSFAPSFIWLLFFAVPLGLGAGAVDAGLNAYVAAQYESRHMSWLHSFWGIGALSGPLVLSSLFTRGLPWRGAYLAIGVLQVVLVLALIVAVPLWNRVRSLKTEVTVTSDGDRDHEKPHQPLFFALRIRGVKVALVAFLCYCGIESTMGLWGGSFLFKTKGLDASTAAAWVSLFYASITAGRFVTGFITYRLKNETLIRAGAIIVMMGVAVMLAPLDLSFTLMGFILVGFGCAPIYPCMLHETPRRFGVDNAQAIMGFQMAVAYVGATFLPPLFGFIATATTLSLLPLFLIVYVVLLFTSTIALGRKLRG